MQWRGELADIRAQLESLGWQDHSQFHTKQALLWLSKTRPIDELALLPQVHDGRAQALAMLLPIDPEREWVLRLWHSGWQLDGTALWLGNIAPYRVENLLDNLRVPWLEGDFDAGPTLLRDQLKSGAHQPKQQLHPSALADPAGTHWDGRVLLLDSPTSPP